MLILKPIAYCACSFEHHTSVRNYWSCGVNGSGNHVRPTFGSARDPENGADLFGRLFSQQTIEVWEQLGGLWLFRRKDTAGKSQTECKTSPPG